MSNEEVTNLEELLDQVGKASEEGGEVSWAAVMRVVGRRSFGPLLLVAGVTTLAPIIGDIPGVPTIIGLFVLLIAVQLLLKRDHFWLPRFLLNRSVAQTKLGKALNVLRRPARFVDRFLRPRLETLVSGTMTYMIALACLGIAMLMPIMEVIPFSANLAGAALTAFGLALIARDGLLALVAYIFTASIAGLIIYNFL